MILHALFGLSCESGAVVESTSESPDPDRAGLVVTLGVDPAFLDAANSLGGPESVLSGVEVRIHRVTTPIEEWLEATSDSMGVARFNHLLPGLYRIVASRVVSAEGVQTRAFAGGHMRRLQPGDSVEIEVRADVAGGLVISEYYGIHPGDSYPYWFHQYLKVFNNSDRTIHLDGMILGRGFFLLKDRGFSTFRCTETEPFRMDRDGLWFYGIYRFPGAGGEFPIGPGEEKLIATDAIDHRPFSPFGVDLRNADFETLGSADVDNPAVPNLVELGPRIEPRGHGLFTHPEEVLFLASPTDLATLPRREHCSAAGCDDYARMPAASILDVFALWDDGYREAETPPCNPPIEPIWDQMPGGFVKCCQLGDLDLSVKRRVLRVENGRNILMDTNVSAADFVKGARTVQ